jgi:acyl-CoA hydrolase
VSEVVTVTNEDEDEDDTDDPPPTSGDYEVVSDQDVYELGATADAVWDAPSNANIYFDWIGLYRPGLSDRGYLDYEYTDPFSNREQFPLDELGTFEFRYFKNNSYERVATSPTFEVVTDTSANLCNGYNLDEVTNYPSQSGPIIALGDSITFGIGASEGENYVEELEDRFGTNIINEGVPADTTQDVLLRLEDDVLERDPSTVIVFIGGNDELRRIYETISNAAEERELEDELETFVSERLGVSWQTVPLLTYEETFNNLETIVTEIQDTGANTIVVGFDNTIYNDTIEENYRRIAEETGSIYIPDIYDDIFGRPSRMSDLVHPNDEGYDIVADRIQVGLECLI